MVVTNACCKVMGTVLRWTDVDKLDFIVLCMMQIRSISDRGVSRGQCVDELHLAVLNDLRMGEDGRWSVDARCLIQRHVSRACR